MPRLVLVINVPCDTSGGRSGKGVMACVVTRNTTDECTANTPLGIDRRGGRKARRNSKHEGCTKDPHLISP